MKRSSIETLIGGFTNRSCIAQHSRFVSQSTKLQLPLARANVNETRKSGHLPITVPSKLRLCCILPHPSKFVNQGHRGGDTKQSYHFPINLPTQLRKSPTGPFALHWCVWLKVFPPEFAEHLACTSDVSRHQPTTRRSSGTQTFPIFLPGTAIPAAFIVQPSLPLCWLDILAGCVVWRM